MADTVVAVVHPSPQSNQRRLWSARRPESGHEEEVSLPLRCAAKTTRPTIGRPAWVHL